MNQPRVRRDIRALSPAERARFFFCLKMLDILPPREANNLRVFNVSYYDADTGQQIQARPNNIHDQFIASHQTTCEHGSPIFAYYHRHLTICVQIALNYAEEVLLGGSNAVPNGAFALHQTEWNTVFAKYQSIITSYRQQKVIGAGNPLPQLALHYWNPTDYAQSIVLPPQLSERAPDQIDALYFAVNQHYAWNFNFLTRWFSNLGTIPNDFASNGYFSQTEARYTPTQQGILNGSINPRTQPQVFFSQAVAQNRFGSFNYTISDTAGQLNVYKNYLKLTQTNTTIDVCTLNQSQVDAIFGSKAINLQWVTQNQRSKMSPTSQDNAYVFNKLLPHFQYAYSLLKGGSTFMPNYVTTSSSNFELSMQNCHNTMHNNLQLFMSDSQLSITNLIFFLYHSWIDLALETKIRMIRNSDISQAELVNTNQYLDNIKEASVLDQPSGTPGNITYGDYYIYQWATPLVKSNRDDLTLGPNDYQVAFKAKDFIVNGTVGIRRTDQLSDFYNQSYIPSNGSRYSYFKGFNSFIFNYNYEVYDYNQNGGVGLTLMEGNVVAIPSYIQAIYQDYKTLWDENLTRSTRVQMNVEKQLKVGSKQRTSFSYPQIQEPSRLSTLFNSLSLKTCYELKELMKAIKVTLAGYGSFSSTVKSTILPIAVELTEKGYKELTLNKNHFNTLKRGIVFTFYPMFTRSNGAYICPNCKPEKQIWISCSQHLAEINPQLFCGLMGCFNQEIHYQIVKGHVIQIKTNKICDVLRLTTSKPLLKSLKLIEGAVEVSFKVNFYGKQDYKTSNIKINGFSYSIKNDKLFNIISKKKSTLSCELQLAQVVGINEKSTHNRYVYRLIKVFITNANEYREFQFQIHTYHDLIRYEIDITQREGVSGKYLDVVVKDRDFGFKQSHYALECYEV